MRKAALAAVLLALVIVGLIGIRSRQTSSGETESWLPYEGRGRVSDFLLQLTGGPRGLDSIQTPEGFEVSLAAGEDLVQYGVFFTFDDRGRLFVCESAGKNTTDEEALSSPSFRIRLLEDVDGDGVFDRSKIFADKITMALGAQWYRGSLYVAAPPDFLRFHDDDQDGVADRREVILTGWPIKSNATTLHGPYLGPDGWMYLTYSPQAYEIQTKEGTVLEGPRGRVFRVQPDGSRLEWFVGGGFDNPVEVVFTTAGETIGTNTYYSNPKNGIRDSLLHYVDGGVYPKWRPYCDTAYRRTGDFLPAVTKFARVAPAGLLLYRGTAFGPEYRGNLFSAQFNPHRVQRHALNRTGGTFRTDDVDFLTSTDIDLHVTDVLEDADGSMLVLDTGAWYLHGCPVSRIAKPEFKGAIYRVRKRGAPEVQDPWGREIDWSSLAPERLAGLLGDSRLKVREQALDHLVRRGSASVAALRGILEGEADAEIRAAATFALGRIQDFQAAGAVRDALSDSDLDVRIAAARMVGLNEDRDAVGRLAEMVRSDNPAAQRQAAEALGRLGDVSAVPALLDAAANPEDRFVEHAIIYALIRLEAKQPLVSALGHENPRVRKAALIALDQMSSEALERQHLLPLLSARDEQLSEAVLWVVGHRPEWSSDVIEFVADRLRGFQPASPESDHLRETLLALCSDVGVQRLMAYSLTAAPTSQARRLFLLDTIHGCDLDSFPPSWIEALRSLLDGKDEAPRLKAVQIVGSRRIAALASEVHAIAVHEENPAVLRVAAWSAAAVRGEPLDPDAFQFLVGLTGSGTDSDLRISAAQALKNNKLDRAQKLTLARERLGRADPLVLPVLLDVYRGTKDEEIARAVVAALRESPEPLGEVAGRRFQELIETFPAAVRPEAAPVLARLEEGGESRGARLKELQPLLRANGDVGRGRNIFFGKKAACGSCHTIGSVGGHVGPDLTAVGAVRSGVDILEAIVFPSATFVPGHEVYRVETQSDVFTGVRGPSTETAVTIISGPRDEVRIPRAEIVSMGFAVASLMPDGLEKGLSQQELIDLLAFLQAQKSRSVAEAGD